MPQEENIIWDKLSEAAKATILCNTKIPHKPYTHVNFHDVTLGGLIKASSHQFYFGDKPNKLSNDDKIGEDHHTDNVIMMLRLL